MSKVLDNLMRILLTSNYLRFDATKLQLLFFLTYHYFLCQHAKEPGNVLHLSLNF